MTDSKRIGPQMSAAVQYVSANPGCCILDVARHINLRTIGKNNAYGYNPVHRAIKAGLIVASRGERGAYSLTVPVRACSVFAIDRGARGCWAAYRTAGHHCRELRVAS